MKNKHVSTHICFHSFYTHSNFIGKFSFCLWTSKSVRGFATEKSSGDSQCYVRGMYGLIKVNVCLLISEGVQILVAFKKKKKFVFRWDND